VDRMEDDLPSRVVNERGTSFHDRVREVGVIRLGDQMDGVACGTNDHRFGGTWAIDILTHP
ncbi:MAG TPA: hypothetical protein VF219_16305, partial [Vicinamibacterales bacterium]